MDRHAQGVLLIILSAVAFSSAGFFTRLIHLDVWTMLFWRGLFAGLMILCVIVVQERRRTMAAIRAVGRPGLAAALCSTAATILYLNAFRRTSVADVAVIFAAAPFLTAGLGWLWLGLTRSLDHARRQSFRPARCRHHGRRRSHRGPSVRRSPGLRHDRLHGDHDADHSPAAAHRMLPAACLSALLCPLVGLAIRLAARGRRGRHAQSVPVRHDPVRPGAGAC